MNNTIKDNQIKHHIINENDEIDLVALWQTLIKGKVTIILITGLFATIGLLYAMFATPYFQSTITLYPAGENSEASSILGANLEGLTKSFGLGRLNQSPTYNIPDIINSRRSLNT